MTADSKMTKNKLTFAPLTPERWNDFEKLFGQRGACGGCWCMYWWLRHKDFHAQKGAKNQQAMKKLVKSSIVPGILAYSGKEAIGWCALGPREQYIRFEKSRVLRPIDDLPVWSIVCLFVNKEFRKLGVSEQLLKAAVAYAKKQKALIVEGYPYDLTGRKPQPDPFVWTGLAQSYERAGFKEIARRSPTRPIMRYYTKK
jgi:GNAT superfamily N-acetyltransferase